MRIWRQIFSLFLVLFLVTGCETQTEIVSNLEEREANEIIVFLASKGIGAIKTPHPPQLLGRARARLNGASLSIAKCLQMQWPSSIKTDFLELEG